MLNRIPLDNILFLDIETVPIVGDWEQLSDKTKELWDKKTTYQRNETSPEEYFMQRGGILAEFGKIVCISCGLVANEKARIVSFKGEESKILMDFNDLLQTDYYRGNVIFCAHNGKEFDFPYISRRMIINQIELPSVLQNFGKKPWEIQHLDTLELWKFGDYKHYTSLDLLANIFGLETPKNDIDGSQVAAVYYQDNDIDRIVKYCEGDVLTLINIFRKMRFENPVEREE